MKRELVGTMAMIGSLLMAYGGVAIGAELGGGWAYLYPLFFALGVLFMAYSYVLRVEFRLQKLEAAFRELTESAKT
jgi:hypothetical protein